MGGITSFPGGIGQYVGVAKGGAAGDHTLVAPVTPAIGDVIMGVQQVEFGTNGAISTIVDLTSEFTSPLAAASTISNTGGTATTGALLLVTFVDISAGIG